MSQLYQDQTKLALSNFPFTFHTVAKELVYAIVEIKKAAAMANVADHGISEEMAKGIYTACDEILAGKQDDQFVTCALQGGAGTSINMNVNEVIATLAGVHPLDHVNKSQSTNDVNPSALKIASYRSIETLEISLEKLVQVLDEKARLWDRIPKLARTHLQDAIPTTVGSEFGSYTASIARHRKRFLEIKPYFLELNLGGTAIGDGTNASKTYQETVYNSLGTITNLPVRPTENLMSGTSSQTDFVSLSAVCVSLLVDCSKIASDIRLLCSGPRGGFAELILPEFQKGSTIMPGKVNPVICEVVNQTYYLISGYNQTIQRAAEAAQLELGVMFPILADCLLTTLSLSHEVIATFANFISQIIVDENRCKELLERSTAYATIFSPVLGYDTVRAVVAESLSTKKAIREIIIEKKLLTEEEIERIVHPSGLDETGGS